MRHVPVSVTDPTMVRGIQFGPDAYGLTAVSHQPIIRFRSGLHTFFKAEWKIGFTEKRGPRCRRSRHGSFAANGDRSCWGRLRPLRCAPAAFIGAPDFHPATDPCTLRRYRRSFKYVLKKTSILFQGITSILSYKSTWLALGMSSNSLLSPVNFLKASSLK